MTRVAFCLPTTTNQRDWQTIEETDLWKVLFTSLEKFTPAHEITLFIGYDTYDKVFWKEEERMKAQAVFQNFKIKWFSFSGEYKGKPTSIWNDLAKFAIQDGFDYLKILGDDIRLPNDKDWLSCFINKLKKNDNVGWVAGWSGNDEIPTQFLVHKTHYQIFNYIYPPQIHAWYCDNWMNGIYPQKYAVWLRSYPLLNVGGPPRYQPKDDTNLCKMLLKRYRPTVNRFINDMDK
tara:strand:- start:24 stop:722 length:699 start_codon:yes stop_codon:yes gene_type:complete